MKEFHYAALKLGCHRVHRYRLDIVVLTIVIAQYLGVRECFDSVLIVLRVFQ